MEGTYMNPAVSGQGAGNELAHWGILGMRWGVRRYQNKDGSLTAAGRKRYGDGGPNSDSKSGKKDDNDSSAKKSSSSSTTSSKKVLDTMSDDDLSRMIKRLEMEKKLRDLLKEEAPSDSVKKGKDYAEKIIKAGKVMASVAAISTSVIAIKNNMDLLKKAAKQAKKVST